MQFTDKGKEKIVRTFFLSQLATPTVLQRLTVVKERATIWTQQERVANKCVRLVWGDFGKVGWSDTSSFYMTTTTTTTLMKSLVYAPRDKLCLINKSKQKWRLVDCQDNFVFNYSVADGSRIKRIQRAQVNEKWNCHIEKKNSICEEQLLNFEQFLQYFHSNSLERIHLIKSPKFHLN